MESVKKSVQNAIETGRIGSPVFLRCAIQIGNEAPLLHPLAVVTALANGWMPSKPENVYAQGNAGATQVTLMVTYRGGQLALLSVNRVEDETGMDMMLVGNRGVIYHETPTGRHRFGAESFKLEENGELTDIISQSLETGKPIRVEG